MYKITNVALRFLCHAEELTATGLTVATVLSWKYGSVRCWATVLITTRLCCAIRRSSTVCVLSEWGGNWNCAGM